MRKIEEVNTEYSKMCTELGDMILRTERRKQEFSEKAKALNKEADEIVITTAAEKMKTEKEAEQKND